MVLFFEAPLGSSLLPLSHSLLSLPQRSSSALIGSPVHAGLLGHCSSLARLRFSCFMWKDIAWGRSVLLFDVWCRVVSVVWFFCAFCFGPRSFVSFFDAIADYINMKLNLMYK